MSSKILLLASISAIVTSSFGIEQCSSDATLYVEERKVDHGTLTAFFSIAQKIADGLQPVISNETVAEIKNIIEDENYDRNQLTKTLQRQFKDKQVRTVIFFMTGFVIAVFSLIFGIIVLLWQCCTCFCKGFCCCGKGNESSDKSSISVCSRILLILAFVCCAAFIVAGFIINNQSSSRVFTAVEDSNNFVTEFTGDVLRLYNNSTKSIICAVDTTVNETLDKLDHNAQTAPPVLVSKFKNLTGISLLDEIDWSKIRATLNETSEITKSMRKSIQDLQASSPSMQCESKLLAMKVTLAKVDSQSEDIQNVTQVETIEEDTENQIYNTTKSLAQTFVSDAVNQVRRKWQEFRKTIESSDEVSKSLDDLNKHANDVVNRMIKYYEPAKQGFTLLVVIPSVITVIVILFTTLLLLSYGRDRRGKLPCMAGCGFKITMIGFYIIIVFAFLVVLLSSVEYLGGTMTSAACKTFFQDSNYPGLSVFSLKNAQLLEGHTINISAGDVLMQCKENHTLWTAIGADKAFEVSSVLSDLHLPSIDEETSKLVKQVEKELADFKLQIGPQKNQAGEAAQNLKNLANSLGPYQSFSECSTFNPNATKNIENGVASIKSSLVYCGNEMQIISDVLATIIAKDAKLEQIQKDIKDLAEQPIQEGVKGILDNLTTKLLPCRGVYNAYNNLGTYICGDLGGPIHGLWASAGLCGLCFIVTAILVLVVNCNK